MPENIPDENVLAELESEEKLQSWSEEKEKRTMEADEKELTVQVQ